MTGTNQGSAATAVFNFDGGSGEVDYSIWGTDGAGSQFACYFEDPTLLIKDVRLYGTSYGDDFRFYYSSTQFLTNPPGAQIQGYMFPWSGNDVLRGSTSAPAGATCSAGDYTEDLNGGNGDDTIYGNAGNDSIGDQGGTNTLYGGDGDDCIYGSGPTTALTVYGGDGDDVITTGDGMNTVYGGNGNDDITGGDDDDILLGDAGDDLSRAVTATTRSTATQEMMISTVKVALTLFAAGVLREWGMTTLSGVRVPTLVSNHPVTIRPAAMTLVVSVSATRAAILATARVG